MAKRMMESRTVAENEAPRQRVQLDFTPEAFGRLQEIKEMADAKTNAEVVRNAIRLYDWFLRQKQEDFKFHLVKDDRVKEVELIL